jgi:hypothetical protein
MNQDQVFAYAVQLVAGQLGHSGFSATPTDAEISQRIVVAYRAVLQALPEVPSRENESRKR